MLRYVKRNDTHTPFERPDGMPGVLHRLLMSRGFRTPEEVRAYLHPHLSDLHDPFLLNDMARAVEMIRAAMDRREPICVYGDYDVDGVCASAIMKLWLKSRGADVEVYLPSRHGEGYGLNADAIRKIAQRSKLLITVDCGVTSVELVELAKSLGMRVIVTDHHRPAETLPDCPVVNPLLNDYPFPWLCGAGVAWKLVQALSGEIPMDLIDLAALATVADVVSLTGENRVIVAEGLKVINDTPRPGIAALIREAGLTADITSTGISFQLAPRLNAGGRLETAYDPLELVTTDDAEKAKTLAERLNALNGRRQEIEQDIQAQAEARLQGFDFVRHRAIILAGKDWNPGVLGLVASKLVERYHFPTVILSDEGDKLTGSCRSIDGVDIHAALAGCADTLTRFGGHKKAAGLTLAPERLPDFIDAMDAWLSANVPPEAFIPVVYYDDALELNEVDLNLTHALDGMQPTGMGNPSAVFRASTRVKEAWTFGKDDKHLKLRLDRIPKPIICTLFGEGRRLGDFPENTQVDVLFTPKLNNHNGHDYVELDGRGLVKTGMNARAASNLGEELPLQCDFLTEIIYNTKIDSFAPPEVSPIDPDALSALLSQSPQGTLMIAGDMESASRALALGPCDLFIGRLPDDPRAFNAVCVCPGPGAVPQGYRGVVLIGCPDEWLGQDIAAYRLDGRPQWAALLPDLDDMRSVYRALMALCKRPVPYDSLRELARLTAESSGINPLTAQLSLLVLEDMKLFDYGLEGDAPRLRRLELRKAEPDSSAVWRAIQNWRK